MSSTVHELSNLVLRWIHVAGATFWIGQMVLLAKWSRLAAVRVPESTESEVPEPVAGSVLLRAAAGTTWLSGFLLLGLLFHHGGLLTTPDSPMGRWAAVGLSLGVLPAGWMAYDLLWSRLRSRPRIAGLFSWSLLAAAILGLAEVFSGRAVYLHAGAILATIMAANVWLRLVPAARRPIGPEGYEQTDLERRARHNLHLAFPVVFAMISSHFPTTTYGSTHPVLVLVALLGLGYVAGALHFRRSGSPRPRG